LNGLTVSAGGAAVGNGLTAADLADDAFTNTTAAPVNVVYMVVPVSSSGCLGSSFTVTVTVNPEPVVLNQTALVCSDAPSSVAAATSTNGLPVAIYDITNLNSNGLLSSGGNPAIGNGLSSTVIADDAWTNTTSPSVSVVYTILPYSSNGCSGSMFTQTLNIQQEPTINSVADQIVCFGQVSSAVPLSGSPVGVAFNWINNDNPLSLLTSGNLTNSIPSAGVTPLADADTAFIDITPVFNGCEGEPIEHKIIIVPQLVVNPMVNDTLCSGNLYPGMVFTGNVTGMTFSWSHANPSISENGDVSFPTGPTNSSQVSPFATNPELTFVAPNAWQEAIITVNPSYESCSNGISTTFKIVVKQTPNVFISPSTNFNLCNNQAWSGIDFTGNLDGFATYQWFNNNTSIGLNSNTGTGDIVPFDPTNTGNETQCGNLSVVANYNGCTSSPSPFTICVNPVPVIVPTPDQNLCGNTQTSPIQFQISNALTPVTFTWDATGANIGIDSGSGDNIPATFTPDSIVPVLDGIITVTPTFNGCNGVPDEFHIIVHPVPTVYPTVDQGGCDGEFTNQICFNGSHGANAIYNWSNVPSYVTLATPGVNCVPSFELDGNNISNFTVTPSISTTYNGITLTCQGIADNFIIQSSDLVPTILPTSDFVYCEGEMLTPVTFSGTFNNPSIHYNWDNINNLTGIPNFGQDGIPICGPLTPGTDSIIVTPTNGFCNGSPDTFVVLVKPIPDLIISPSFDSLCHGELSEEILFLSPLAGTTFDWVGDENVGLNPNYGNNVSGIAPFIGDNLDATNGYTPKFDTIIVSSFNNGCAGDIDTLIFTVSPTPSVSTIGTEFTFCPGETVNIPFNTIPSVGTNVSWTVLNGSTTGINNGSGNSLIDVTENTTNTSLESAVVTVNSEFNGCFGDPHLVTINVKLKPVVSNISDLIYCGNVTAPQINFVGTNGATFGWNCDNPSIGSPSLPFDPINYDGINFIPSYTTNNTFVDNNINVLDKTANVEVVPELDGCYGDTANFTIVVKPILTMANIPQDIINCSEVIVPQICFNNAVVAATYEWQFGNTGIGMPASQGEDCIPQWETQNISGNANIVVTPVLDGCDGISETFEIVVVPRPIMDPIADMQYCHNTLTNQVNFTADLPASFTWTRSGDGINSPDTGIDNIPSFTALNPSDPGNDLCANFNVTPQYTSNGLTCPGDVEVVTICVNPLPDVNAGVDTFVCIGQCIELNATGVGFGVMNYSWDQGAQGQQFCPNNTVTLTVTVTDQHLCQSTDDIEVTHFNELPPVVNAGPDDAICFGESYTLSASIDDGNTLFDWSNDLILVNNGEPFTPSESGTYIVIGTSITTQCRSTDTMNLIVNSLPTVTISSPDTVLCAGETTTLTASGAINYQWTNGPATSDYTLTPISSELYEVVGYDQNNCTDTADINVIVNPMPVPIFSSDINFGGCLPFCPVLTDETAGPPSASVVWDFGNGITSTQMGTVTMCFDEYGCYDVTLTSTTAEGCTASSTQQDYLCVNEIKADFYTDPFSATQSILNPEFTFENNSQNATSFEWYFGDGIAPPSAAQSILENPYYTYDDAGFYIVTLVASAQDGCSDTVRKQITVVDELVIHVPNSFTPDGDELNELFIPVLSSGYDRKSGYLFNIYNRWGEIIFTSDQVGDGWDGTFEGAPVPIGTYVWTIQVKDSMSNRISNFNGHVNLIR
jgi:gliding motility-associated-like protein